jgi:hypothetical protein
MVEGSVGITDVGYILRRSTKGAYFAPRGFMNTSTTMDEQVVDEVLEACSRAIRTVPFLLKPET